MPEVTDILALQWGRLRLSRAGRSMQGDQIWNACSQIHVAITSRKGARLVMSVHSAT